VRHQNFIDPASIQVCHQCGDARLLLCRHRIAAVAPIVEEDEPEEVVTRITRGDLKLKHSGLFGYFSGEMDISEYNNGGYISGSRLNTKNVHIIDDLYSYLYMRKEIRYENRNQCLIHLKKLSQTWFLNKKVPENPVTLNRMFITIQKVADETDSSSLLAYRNPSRFGLNWFNVFGAILGVLMSIALLYYGCAELMRPIQALNIIIHQLYHRVLASELLANLQTGSMQNCHMNQCWG